MTNKKNEDTKRLIMDALTYQLGAGTVNQVSVAVAKMIGKENEYINWNTGKLKEYKDESQIQKMKDRIRKRHTKNTKGQDSSINWGEYIDWSDFSENYDVYKFKKRIMTNLNDLAKNDKYLYKGLVDENGNYYTKEQTEKTAKHKFCYFLNKGHARVSNLKLLTKIGVTIIPLNNDCYYYCDELNEYNSTLSQKNCLLFVNDYHKAIYLKLKKEPRNHYFIFTKNNHNEELLLKKANDYLNKKNIPREKCTIVLLHNDSLNYGSLESGFITAKYNAKNLFIYNDGYEEINIGTDLFFFNPEHLDNKFKEYRNRFPLADTMPLMRSLDNNNFFNNKEKRLIRKSTSENLYAFSPIFFNFLSYQIVINMG